MTAREPGSREWSRAGRSHRSGRRPRRFLRAGYYTEGDGTLTSRKAVAMTYTESPNKLVSAANGVDYAYREVGDGGVPLVLLQHFRGNLDSWDPALIDALASGRRVVTFDNTGVGGSSGETPNTVEQMARDAIAFIA